MTTSAIRACLFVLSSATCLLGCVRDQENEIEIEGQRALGGKHGVILLYVPSCQISSSLARALNLVAATPGLVALVSVVASAPDDPGASRTLAAAGVRTPHSSTEPSLRTALMSSGQRLPAVLVYRYGRLIAILSDSGLDHVDELLPTLFPGLAPEPPSP